VKLTFPTIGRAIEQLGNSKLEIRLGGIYALEQIARDSEKDHWPIMEVLTAYIRENAQRKEKTNLVAPLATDIQAILTVIRRREWSYEKMGQNLDLHRTDLHGANLMDAHLEDADLTDADLTDAVLGDAHLECAVLTNAVLRGRVPKRRAPGQSSPVGCDPEGCAPNRHNPNQRGPEERASRARGPDERSPNSDGPEERDPEGRVPARRQPKRRERSDPGADRFSHRRRHHQAADGHRHAGIVEAARPPKVGITPASEAREREGYPGSRATVSW
jgi:hypothetical protein